MYRQQIFQNLRDGMKACLALMEQEGMELANPDLLVCPSTSRRWSYVKTHANILDCQGTLGAGRAVQRSKSRRAIPESLERLAKGIVERSRHESRRGWRRRSYDP